MFDIQKKQQPVKIYHPHVRDAYLKKEKNRHNQEENVLVIAARNDRDGIDSMTFGDFDSHLYDLVADLQSLKEQAEKHTDAIDRVDIHTH